METPHHEGVACLPVTGEYYRTRRGPGKNKIGRLSASEVERGAFGRDKGGKLPWPNQNTSDAQDSRPEPPRGPRLTSEEATQWLTAVLLAWRNLVVQSLPMRVRHELDKTVNSVQNDLL